MGLFLELSIRFECNRKEATVAIKDGVVVVAVMEGLNLISECLQLLWMFNPSLGQYKVYKDTKSKENYPTETFPCDSFYGFSTRRFTITEATKIFNQVKFLPLHSNSP